MSNLCLDVKCELIKGPNSAHRVILSFRDWENGAELWSHNDFATRDQALDSIANAIVLFQLRKSPWRDVWRNKTSPGFRRAIRRAANRVRHGRLQGTIWREIYDRLHWALDEIVADPQAPENLRAAILKADMLLRCPLTAPLRATARDCLEKAILGQTADPAGLRRAMALQALLGALGK